MKIFPRCFRILVVVVCFIICAFLPALASGDEWRQINPAELSSQTSTVEKDADAEALFWEVRVDDSQPEELVLKNYIRIKVFTDRGKESQSKVDLTYLGSSKIKDVAARVIKVDGSIVELKKEDIFDRTIVKASGVKYKAKSFALPSVEPGVIIEYRWQEVYPNGSANRLRLAFQREIPVQQVTYYLRPFTGMRYNSFHMEDAKFVKDKDSFFKLTKTNMPAYREEPRMPPEDEVRAWVFLYYSEDTKLDAEKYWKDFGRRYFELTKDEMKVNDDVKNAVAGIIATATTPEQKLELIYDFCRTKIKNINDDASTLSDEEKKKARGNKSPADTLKRGMGTGSNIDMLFAALARAAGFDARPAVSGNRDDFFFSAKIANGYLLESSFVAVLVGEGWQFFSPSEMYTSFGMLGWPEEGQDALITDSKEPLWVKTPMSPAEKSLEKRTGKLRLLEDGTLEGDVRIEYSGHLAFDKKEYNDDDSPAQREETLRSAVKARMSTAELSDIKIENVTDPVKPFVYSYHLRVPGYAQRTGKRLFVQPGVLARGTGPLFSAAARKNEVYFHYPWSEQDHLTIELPEGFALDSPDVPAPITPEMTQRVCEQKIKMAVTTDGRTLIYDRKFFFGGGGSILFPVQTYPALKSLFDMIATANNHTITLKQVAVAGN
ncbi:MAG: hypothetical protein QOG23_4180 [Blastocatellia bacterium]|jgi:hypothetical protein|nr:hypothetical protein [Blastocatellia bacterium]